MAEWLCCIIDGQSCPLPQLFSVFPQFLSHLLNKGRTAKLIVYLFVNNGKKKKEDELIAINEMSGG